MNEIVSLLPSLIGGIVLGILFFGGLWLTIRKGIHSKRPTLLFFSSLIIRLTIVVFGFYYIGANSWVRILVCLAGFLIARVVITRITIKDKQAEVKWINKENDEN